MDNEEFVNKLDDVQERLGLVQREIQTLVKTLGQILEEIEDELPES